MNDKAIRNILIAYISAKEEKVRIYQEKNIGRAICDVMAVTECLTGYEIKSDVDNLSRLEMQIVRYSEIFDRNYVVVGECYKEKIITKVPWSWGILVIRDNEIFEEREAILKNGAIKSQLSLLWTIELKNLLNRFDMPLYTYKTKEFIIEKLCDRQKETVLHKALVYELINRDYTIYNAKDYTIKINLNDEQEIDKVMPTLEIVDALSEQNLQQITLDQWISLYSKAKEIQTRKIGKYDDLNKERMKHDISYADIKVALGVPWLDKHIVEDFIYYVCTGREDKFETKR